MLFWVKLNIHVILLWIKLFLMFRRLLRIELFLMFWRLLWIELSLIIYVILSWIKLFLIIYVILSWIELYLMFRWLFFILTILTWINFIQLTLILLDRMILWYMNILRQLIFTLISVAFDHAFKIILGLKILFWLIFNFLFLQFIFDIVHHCRVYHNTRSFN